MVGKFIIQFMKEYNIYIAILFEETRINQNHSHFSNPQDLDKQHKRYHCIDLDRDIQNNYILTTKI